MICVQRLHGVIGREPIRPDEMPVGAQLTSMKWREFDLQGVRAQVERDEGPSFTLVAQVPLIARRCLTASRSTNSAAR